MGKMSGVGLQRCQEGAGEEESEQLVNVLC
jgi:hypothetical protein